MDISSKIKSLSLRNASIGKVGVQILSAGLYKNEYLKILDLGSNSITFESFKDLCDSLNNNRIKTLRLRNNLLKDESAKYFSETILNKKKVNWVTNRQLDYLFGGLLYCHECGRNIRISEETHQQYLHLKKNMVVKALMQ